MEWICRVVEKNAHQFISPVFLLISFIVVFDIETKKGRVFNCTNCLTRKFKNWAFAKICWKLTVLMRFVEIFNLLTIILIIWKFHTPRFGREIVERRLQKKSFYIATFMKKNFKNYIFLERTVLRPCDYVLTLVFPKTCSKKYIERFIFWRTGTIL